MTLGFKIEVWGPNACFTRPEMKVERVSYDVITPSAGSHILASGLEVGDRPDLRPPSDPLSEYPPQ